MIEYLFFIEYKLFCRIYSILKLYLSVLYSKIFLKNKVFIGGNNEVYKIR